MIIDSIVFPAFTGIKCNMMPFIQGDSKSIPEEYKAYADIINNIYLEKGLIGYLTIDESFVEGGKSQRGFNSRGIDRNVHVEVGSLKSQKMFGSWGDSGGSWGGSGGGSWGGSGGGSWGGSGGGSWGSSVKRSKTFLHRDTQVLIANSLSNTCRYWDKIDTRYTDDGDLSEYIKDYPEKTGILMKSGEVAKISIFTPHEPILQPKSSKRQFFRIIGDGVIGGEDYFTVNPLMK
jgi:hypothetical protein